MVEHHARRSVDVGMRDRATDEVRSVDNDCQFTDAQLIQLLNEPTEWFIVDDRGQMLAVALSLRHALRRTRMVASGGMVPHLLVRASGGTGVVRSGQLRRLCSRLREDW
jgi:hypothetical protein